MLNMSINILHFIKFMFYVDFFLFNVIIFPLILLLDLDETKCHLTNTLKLTKYEDCDNLQI